MVFSIIHVFATKGAFTKVQTSLNTVLVICLPEQMAVIKEI